MQDFKLNLKLLAVGLFAAASLLSVGFASYSMRISAVGACFRRASIQITSGRQLEACPAPSSIDRVLIPLMGPPGFVDQWESIAKLIERLRQGTRDGAQDSDARPAQPGPV